MNLDSDNLTYDNIGEKFDIPIEEERELWEKYYINKFIYVPTYCPKCNAGTISLVKNQSVINPLKGSCNNKDCKNKIFLRKFSIFKNFNKLPIQVLMNIVKCMIIKKKNATQIRKYIKNKYNGVNLNIRSIYKFMLLIRKSIACYIKNIYITKEISTLNGNDNYAIDESLFTHINNENIWVIGIVDTSNNFNFRCNISNIRNHVYLKKFIEKYIKRGNNIISDGWSGLFIFK